LAGVVALVNGEVLRRGGGHRGQIIEVDVVGFDALVPDQALVGDVHPDGPDGLIGILVVDAVRGSQAGNRRSGNAIEPDIAHWHAGRFPVESIAAAPSHAQP
jgi:hypothetical protein